MIVCVNRCFTCSFCLISVMALAGLPLPAQLVPDGATNTLANVTNNITGDVTVGTNGSFTLLTLSDNALLTNSVNGVLGRNASAKSNEVQLVSASARWRMGSFLYVGSNGAMSRLVVSNGGFVDNLIGVLGQTTASSNNTALITGNGSFWNNRNDLRIGNSAPNNQMIVSNGGWVASLNGALGASTGSSSNLVVVTGSGSVWSNVSGLTVGNFAPGNRLLIEAGGLVHCDNGLIGSIGAGSNNQVLVTGAGSLWTNHSFLTIGGQRPFNRLVVSNGAAVWSGTGVVGSSNSVVVTGTGSGWSNQSLIVGGVSSRVDASAGGWLASSEGYLGQGAGADSNTVVVTGAGAGWNNTGNLFVGDQGSGNVLIASNGATVLSSNLFVGFNSGASNNRVIVDSGTLRVTNASGTGVLDVRRGAATLQSGLVEVDRLLVTNSQGSFVFDGGTLSSKSTTASNGLSFHIGNNVGAATFILAGNGTHTFTALTVDNLGTLTGNGTVVLPAPNLVVVLDGGTISPGASIGRIGFNNQLLVFGTTFLEINKTGAVLTNDQIQISGGLTHNGHLTVTNIGPTPLAAGDRFPLFSAPFATDSLASLTLPPLGTGLTWTNKFAVDGSLEVLGLIVQTLPASGAASNTVTLNGVVNPGGQSATAWFEWGTTTNYGNVTMPQALGSGTNHTNLSQVLTGLFGGVTYHVRTVASNSHSLVFGQNQSFTVSGFHDIGAGLPEVQYCSLAWGDYDSDGRLDIVLTGATTNGPVAQLWRNTGSGFTNVKSLDPVYKSSVAWGDLNNDGLLDLITAGSRDSDAFPDEQPLTLVWLNLTNAIDIYYLLAGADLPSVAWGDYDNDGRLDVLLTGLVDDGNPSNEIPLTQIWCNTGTGFTNLNAELPGVFQSSVAWGDYDNDGRLDFLLTGRTNLSSVTSISQVWRNTGSGFTNINAGLPGVYRSSVAWADYDNDGWLDILLTGATTNTWVSQVWRNTGNGFTNINASLPGVWAGSAAWGDYDNDGRLDILLTGNFILGGGLISQVWRNTGSGFTNINAALPGVFTSSAGWGDYDNDGRLDVLLAGGTFESGGEPLLPITQVWRNQTPFTNTPPTAPNGLAVTLAGDNVTLSWNAASDAQTPASSLTYNVRIGTTPGASDVMGPMASPSGQRRLPQMGNAQLGLTARFKYTVGTAYYWSVQAVDSAFAGSPFSAGSSFKVLQLPAPDPVVVSVTTTNLLAGDLDGDGAIDRNELQIFLADFFATSPFLYMTNVAGLGGTEVTFALTNDLTGAFSVEYTTNFADWEFLGPATPRYLFTDTNASAIPERYYRLRWP